MPRRRGRRRRYPPDRPHLLEVLERVLDKGIVIDGWGEIALGGIPLLAVQMHFVVSSFETYLRHAGAATRLGGLPGPSEEELTEGEVLPNPEAVVRAVEEYLRQLRPPEP